MLNGIGIDGDMCSSEKMKSQYAHLLDSFSGIIDVIKNNNIQNANRKMKKINPDCKKIFQLEARRNSLKSFMNCVMMGLEKPEKIENYRHEGIFFGTVYLMTMRPTYWSSLEIYRDLNITCFNELDSNEQISLAEESGYVSFSNNKEIMKINFEKGFEWLVEEDVKKEYALISSMYGSTNNSFIYKNREYKICDLLNVYKKIKKYFYEREDLWFDKFSENRDTVPIQVLGERALIRLLGLKYTDIDLIRLLTFDIKGNDNTTLLNYKPLIRSGSVYYLVLAWIEEVSLGRALDKIFSDYENVKIDLNEHDGKGLLFENTIENFFRVCDISFFSLNKDYDNGIPEIDGMFIIDHTLFVFEAKATIKPETTMEAYNQLNSKLTKARDQLDERVEVFKDLKKVKLIEKKIKQNISGYKIVPFVLLNHPFFNGYNELTSNSGDEYYPIIDFLLLKEIIRSKKVPTWMYDEGNNYYKRIDRFISTGEELEVYLNNQVEGLLSFEKPTFQLLEDNIMFRINKPIKTKMINDVEKI